MIDAWTPSYALEYEAACEATVTKAQAFAEIDKHDIGLTQAEAHAEFIKDCGDHETYPGQLVLDWLGY